jgi:hypothetical protein
MHSYPLHCLITVECLCCHVAQEFTFSSRSDQVVCKGCARHQGDTAPKANQRDADHVALWRSELAIALEDHAEQVKNLRSLVDQRDQQLARQQAEINDLRAAIRAGVEGAPLPAVERWWSNEQVAAASQERDAAYRSRDHAYRALWAVDRLHHEDENRDRYCSCDQAGCGVARQVGEQPNQSAGPWSPARVAGRSS